jgi:hypothetical protein
MRKILAVHCMLVSLQRPRSEHSNHMDLAFSLMSVSIEKRQFDIYVYKLDGWMDLWICVKRIHVNNSRY